ncbi:hypothetical protein K6T82_05620 [Flavobacterium sp. 17A]|uniref:Uncharacterized protein n=1 Tax=Flavobacterium potami TaxID=2872310 RepID=A0A9X1H843_9FLAO|nr:hypothetical protein [Flavobacterium potami]MBZ4034235.1 hypothetical protein [Flavobacterium potami]
MAKNTIIFKTGQLLLPEKTELHFITDLLHAGQLELDYIGEESHSQNGHPEEVSLLEFHFETEAPFDYGMQESELKNLLASLLEDGSAQIKTSGNDIMVYL